MRDTEGRKEEERTEDRRCKRKGKEGCVEQMSGGGHT